MIQLTATSHGFHLLNGADAQLSPYLLLHSAANATGRMISYDSLTWEWDVPSSNAPYAIRAHSTGEGTDREISEIDFYRIENGQDLLIGTMELSNPIAIQANPPSSADALWTTEIALPFRMAVKDQALSVSGLDGDDYIDLTDPMMALHDPIQVNTRGGADHIKGGLGDDIIRAGKGDDVITDAYGNNELRGGRGDDQITTSDPNGSSTLGGGWGNDTLISGAGGDRLRGGKGDDRLDAGAGHDSLKGGAGDDHLISGSGNDWMQGGAGRDMFETNMALSGKKTVADFDPTEDLLFLVNFNGGIEDLSFDQQGKDAVLIDDNTGFKLVLKDTDVDDLMTADIQIA